MHKTIDLCTPSNICFAKIHFFCFFCFKPENVSEKWRRMWDLFQSCSSSQKINSFKMPNNNNRHLKWYLKDRFSVPKYYMGREGVFVIVILERISDDVRCTLFPPTPVADAELCTTTNC